MNKKVKHIFILYLLLLSIYVVTLFALPSFSSLTFVLGTAYGFGFYYLIKLKEEVEDE